MRLIDADAYCAEMKERQYKCIEWRDESKAKGDAELFARADQALATFVEARLTMEKMPTVDAVCVTRCRDCEYAPLPGKESSGMGVEYPEPWSNLCPFRCEDSWYNTRPEPNWFC